MKLADEFGIYTEEGKKFSKDIERALEPLIKEYIENGSTRPEVVYIILGAVQLSCSKYATKKYIEKLKGNQND